MSDVLLWAGAAAVAFGAWMFHPGLGLIVAGAFLLGFGVMLGIPSKRKGRDP
jgi:hypothetical protein